ncbi:MAG: tRNA lysidine(34) synthetase TilS, partial [Gemmatimonadales bacterium]
IRRDEEAVVLQAAASALGGVNRIVLAVSGGLDSMVLLDAVAAGFAAKKKRLIVATFDHRSGPHSAAAARFVEKRAGELGLKCVVGRASAPMHREHEWREARWEFLRQTAAKLDATIVTAHTLDDQIETVFMRILRNAGPRGLAGLFAESEVVRPFLRLRRSQLEAYARSNHVKFLRDPSNNSRAHLRNRVRHDLLPAISRVRPAFSDDLLSLAQAASVWRIAMTGAVERIGYPGADGSLRVARSDLAGYDAESLRALWPAIAAKAGVVMDRRGTHRLAEFTMKGHTGGSIQLSGGIEVRMFRDHMVIRRWDARRVEMIRNSRLRPVSAHAWMRAET